MYHNQCLLFTKKHLVDRLKYEEYLYDWRIIEVSDQLDTTPLFQHHHLNQNDHHHHRLMNKTNLTST